MTVAGSPTYRVVAGDVVADRARVMEVWRGNLGTESRMAERYDWFYLGCPFGAPLLLLLHASTEPAPVGVATAGARAMLIDGRPALAGVLVGRGGTPAHRSLFPALQLQRAMLAEGTRRFAFLYGLPNRKAQPVFARAGYRKLGELTRYLRVLRSAPYLRRKLPAPLATAVAWFVDAGLAARDRLRSLGSGLAGAWHERAPDAIDRIWQASPRPRGAVAPRDARFARWRFARAIRSRIDWFVVSRGGEPVAWFACEAEDHLLHVLDFWSVDGAAGVLRRAFLTLSIAARARGHAGVSVEYFGTEAGRRMLASLGFEPRSGRPLMFQPAPAHEADVGSWDWHFTSADEDE